LQQVRLALLKQRHLPIHAQGAWLRSVIQAFLNYQSVSGNMASLEAFRTQGLRHWLHALRRRSRRSNMPWK